MRNYSRFNILYLIFASVLSPVAARTLPKVYDVNYKDNQVLKMYAGGKATLRLNAVPYDADAVQVSFGSDNIVADGQILGPRSMIVNRGAGSNYVEFNVELPELATADLYKRFKLNIKSFKKTSDVGYQVIDKIETFISPTSCADEKDDEVCGVVQSRCPDDQKCVPINTEKTFRNECELSRYGADYLHHGACKV